MTVKTRLAVLFVAACLFTIGLLMLLASNASARPRVPAPVYKAVRANWKTRWERIRAFDVVACETGNTYDPEARNGQYLGLFQMGSWARARYGHGSTARAQARAAYRLYLDCGWGQWSCP